AAAAVLVVGVGGWMAMGDSQGAASMTAAPSSEARPGAAASPGDMQAARVAAERAKLEAEVARIRAEEEAAEEERTQKLAEQQKAAEASAESADEDSASGGASASRRSSRRTGTASKSLSGGSSAQPDTPSKSDVLSAMKGVEPRVMACRKGRHGVLTVKMTVSGSTGRVTGTSVTGSFVGSPEGDCAMRAVRSASFPKFRKNSFSIAYPFRF
ncbi:MAG: hypothetical protein KC417_08180, partial [Myxococcales bacterium]|nr:hypothetical protein [Myxococcales bacterium]